MTRHLSPSRRTRTIPGLRRCHTCGHIYTRHAMVCPICHGYGPLNALAAALGRNPAEPQLAPGEFVVDLAAPSVATQPAPQYPAWLTHLAAEIGNSNEQLEHLLVWRNMSDDLRSLMRAVIYCRTKKALPATFGEPAARALVAESSWNYILEAEGMNQ